MRRFSTDCTTALLWTPRPGAVIAQKVENVYFGKPCGLMDQMASSVGGMVTIDFKEQDAKVEAIACNFAAKGYALCVVNTGGDHGDLTDDYAAIRKEMEAVAAHFGKHVLREVELETGGKPRRRTAQGVRRPRGAARVALLRRECPRAGAGGGPSRPAICPRFSTR